MLDKKMVSVNFKPSILACQKEQAKKKAKAIFPVVCGSIAFFTIISMIGIGLLNHSQENSLAEVNAALNQLKHKQVYTEQIQKHLQIAKEKLTFLNREDNTEKYNDIVEKIQQNLPKNTWLSSLKIDNGKIDFVKGYSLDIQSIGGFLANLKGEDELQCSQLIISQVRRRGEQNSDYLGFDIGQKDRKMNETNANVESNNQEK